MNEYFFISTLLCLTMSMTYIIYRFTKVQTTIVITIIAFLLSIGIKLYIELFGHDDVISTLIDNMQQINFHDLLIYGMLNYLLFAGALHINYTTLISKFIEVSALSFISTILSTFLIGYGLFYILFNALGIDISFIECLLFGALISPTDPIAVLGVLKELNAPSSIQIKLAGESLFNDGIGIVIFSTILQIMHKTTTPDVISVSIFFLQQTIGGCLLGAIFGYITSKIIATETRNTKSDIVVTLAFVSGSTLIAKLTNISGPISMVVYGIILNHLIKHSKFKKIRKEILYVFWDIIDEILNLILFVLIGLESISFYYTSTEIYAIFYAILLCLFARLISVAVPMQFINIWLKTHKNVIPIISWGGLKGGLAIALALSVPKYAHRNLIIDMTYGVVLFSIIVQGLSIKPFIKRLTKKSAV